MFQHLDPRNQKMFYKRSNSISKLQLGRQVGRQVGIFRNKLKYYRISRKIITASSKNRSVKKLNTNWDVMAGMTQKRALKALFSLQSLENKIFGV